MKLRTKTLAVLVLTTFTFAACAFCVGSDIIIQESQERDLESARNKALSVEAAIQGEVRRMDYFSRDWGMWDDAWFFVQYGNTTFVDDYLNARSLASNKLDVMLFYNLTHLVHGAALDRTNESLIEVPEDLIAEMDANYDIRHLQNEGDFSNGIISLQSGCAAFSAHPILRSDSSGPIAGTIVSLVYLRDDFFSEISEIHGVRVVGEPAALSADHEFTDGEISIKYVSDTTLSASWGLPDIHGSTAMIIDMEVPRVAYQSGQAAVGYIVHATLVMGAALFAVLAIFLDRVILKRLDMAKEDVIRISNVENGERRVRVFGNDEFSDLCRELNNMNEALERYQEELLDKDRIYRMVVENSPNAVFMVEGTEGRLTDVNPTFVKMTGYAPEELGSIRIDDFLIEPEVWLGVTLAGTRKDIYEGEGWIRDKQGRCLEVELGKSELTHGTRRLSYFVARDVTDKNRSERERQRLLDDLFKANQRLTVTLGSITDGVVAIEDSGTVVLVNSSAERMLGKASEDIIGRKFFESLQLPEEQRRMIASMRSGGPFLSADLISGEKGREVEYSFNTMFDDAGSPIGTVFVFRDVTHRARAEIAAANAERLESIGTLAGGIAHDFNNILTSTIGDLFLLRKELDGHHSSDQRMLERIIRMERAIEEGRSIAHELLSLSKGGEPIKRTIGQCEICEILGRTGRLVFTGSSMLFSLECPEDLWPVNIDPDQISRAVMNALFNAQDASKPSDTVRLIARNFKGAPGGMPEGRYVVIEVIDQGVGIPPESLPKVFDPFFTTKSDGTGLGMTIMYSIIKRHGGTVKIESEVGKGTTVSMYIPVSDVPIEERSPAPDGVEKGSGRILIMDDQEAILTVMSEILQDLGYRVDTAVEGGQALKMYEMSMREGDRYDAVIMDLTVPGGMGGKETISELRRLDPHAVAIVSSGYSNDPVMANYKEHGFSDVIPKPYTIEQLSNVLKRALSKDRNGS